MPTKCANCSKLADKEYAMQKYASDNNTWLPAAAAGLSEIHDFAPGSSRKRILKKCLECGTHYLYRTDYEYVMNGSEDEEFLERLDETSAEELLHQAGLK